MRVVQVAEVFGDRRWSREVEAHRGVNRVSWDLRFAPTEREREEARRHLLGVIAFLRERVDEPASAVLDALRERLGEGGDPPSPRSLSRVRAELVADFAVYAPGRPLFGTPIGPTPAPAGEYRVTVRMDGLEATGSLRVREDPLLGD